MNIEQTGEEKEVELLQQLFYFVAKNTAKRSRPPEALIKLLDEICLDFVAKNTAKRSRPPEALIKLLDEICLAKYGKKFDYKDFL